MLHLCVKVSLDMLYMSAAKHVFKKKMKPLLFEEKVFQRKKSHTHIYNKEIVKVDKAMRKYIQCIQSSELAAATAHRITEELPPGKNDPPDSCFTDLSCCVHVPSCFYASQVMRRHSCWGSVWLLGIPGRKIKILRSVYETQLIFDSSQFIVVFVVYSCLNRSRRQHGQEERPFSPRWSCITSVLPLKTHWCPASWTAQNSWNWLGCQPDS